MREIKFRAWDKGEDVMLDDICINTDHFTDMLNRVFKYWEDTLEFMQYTGLNDKNGKEIYEGDIIRILYPDWASQSPDESGEYKLSIEDYKKSISKVGVVEFYVGNSIAEYGLNFGGYSDNLKEGRHGEKEIIGNIYENPELLKEK